MSAKNEGKVPLKPDRPLASIVFSDEGKVSRNIEHPPRTQKELELAIGSKFLYSLAHFQATHLSDLKSVEGRADLVAHREDGAAVLIQVAEVVDQAMRRINEPRRIVMFFLRINFSIKFR